MEIPSTSPKETVNPKNKSKTNLAKLLTERKSHQPNHFKQISVMAPDTNDKLPLLQLERQSPITYLDSIQSAHQQIQKSLDQSFMTSSKWRSYNSPLQTPKNPSVLKENVLFQTLYSKRKQLSAIKVYNHVNNQNQIPTKKFAEPQFLDFIQEAVSKSTRKSNLISATQTPTQTSGQNTKRISTLKKVVDIKQSYTIKEQRKQLQKLQFWIKSKVQTYQQQQKQGESMFTDRINFMNMAFYEVSRQVGTFSNDAKNIIDYLHQKYYDYYNCLTECLIEQNKKIQIQISAVEDRLLKTITHYEEKITKSKKENEEKAEKIVVNFQKCIEMKKKLDKENKEIKHNLSNVKKNSKLIEQALVKVITIFLALGQKNIHAMTFSLDSFSENSEYIQSSMLAISKKHIQTVEQMEIQRRKLVFQEWCGYIIKMVHRILIKDMCQQQGVDMRTAIYKKQAFQVIKQYMTENDDSLSPADAENILNKFLSTEEEELKLRKNLQNSFDENEQMQKDLMDLQKLNRKFENMYSEVAYKLPSFQQVYNRMNVQDVDVQVNFKNEVQNWGVQTYVDTEEIGIMVIPRTKTRQVDVSSELRQKIDLHSETVSFCEVFKISKPKERESIVKKTNTKDQDGYRIRLNDTQNSQKMLKLSNNLINSSSSLFQNGHQPKKNDIQKFLNSNGGQNLITGANNSGRIFEQIGVNTDISRSNRNKMVEFNVPEFFSDQNNHINNLQSEQNEQHGKQSKSSLQNINSAKNLNTYTSLMDSIKQDDNESIFKQFEPKKAQPRRKNGFLITGKVHKTHLSQKFIKSIESQSSDSDISILSDDDQQNSIAAKQSPILNKNNQKSARSFQNKTKESSFPKRQQFYRPQSLENKAKDTFLSKRQQFLRPEHKKIHQTLQERSTMGRSYFNLSHVEYATKEDADSNRIKNHVIRVPKKKTFKEKYVIDPHDFHVELAFKNSEKVKFLTSITLWPPKLMSEMKKIRQRVKAVKPIFEIQANVMNLVRGYLTNIVNPILRESLKSYCQLMKNDKFDFGGTSLSTSIKALKSCKSMPKFSRSQNDKNMKTSSAQLSYNQRLSPLLYNLIYYTQYHLNRTSSDNEIFFSGLKALRNKNSKMEVYSILVEGRCVQVDIFVKTIYQFNLLINGNVNYSPEINCFVLESGLFEALDSYFSAPQIQKIILQAKKFILMVHENLNRRRSIFRNDNRKYSFKGPVPKKMESNSKICYFELLLIIFRNLKEKQKNHSNKYSIIKEVISRNSQCTAYEDIMHFLQCLPVQNDKKKKILGDCLTHVVYWNSNEASVPNDIFYFILDKYELYNSNPNQTQNTDVIKEYIVNRCELYFKATLQKVIKNREWALNSTYILSYKIPKLFHRISYQIRTGRDSRDKKILYCLLTLVFCNLIDIEMEKKYIPSLLNGLIAVPLP